MSDDLRLARQLALQDPTRADLAVDVTVSLVYLADVTPDEAVGLLGEARQILEVLAESDRLPPNGATLLEHLRAPTI